MYLCLRQRRKLAPGRLPLLVAHRFSIFAFSSAVISGFFLIWKILNFHKIVLFVWFWSLSHLRDLLVPLLLLIPLLLLLLHHVLHLHQLGRPGVNLVLKKKRLLKRWNSFKDRIRPTSWQAPDLSSPAPSQSPPTSWSWPQGSSWTRCWLFEV